MSRTTVETVTNIVMGALALFFVWALTGSLN